MCLGGGRGNESLGDGISCITAGRHWAAFSADAITVRVADSAGDVGENLDSRRPPSPMGCQPPVPDSAEATCRS